jgi:hypothetical protein
MAALLKAQYLAPNTVKRSLTSIPHTADVKQLCIVLKFPSAARTLLSSYLVTSKKVASHNRNVSYLSLLSLLNVITVKILKVLSVFGRDLGTVNSKISPSRLVLDMFYIHTTHALSPKR